MSDKPLFGTPISDWYGWFAWYPVKTYDQRWRFFCIVEKRCIARHSTLLFGPDFWFQYRCR